MGQQVSVETLSSSPDSEGHKYWASFDPYPFKIGARKLAYMGILNGDGPLRGEKCVVKTVRAGSINRRYWLLESKTAKISRALAGYYNKIIPPGGRQITFNYPIIAEIDTVSDCLCINDILSKPKKKFAESEFVSIELYLKGKFEVFEYGWVPESELFVSEAFSHFSWCRSEGTLLISNLQGVKTPFAYHFTGPTIHSEDSEYGQSDQGINGIKEFFKLHQCNNVCKNWPRFGDGVDLRGWGEYIGLPLVERRPSAPPPDLANTVPLSPPPYVEEAEAYPVSQARTGFRQRPTLTEYGPLSPPVQPWRESQGPMVDWREEFFNQQMTLSARYGSDNTGYQQDGAVATRQLLLFVRQMSYAVYAAPPPAYCGCQGFPSQLEKTSPHYSFGNETPYSVCNGPPYGIDNCPPYSSGNSQCIAGVNGVVGNAFNSRQGQHGRANNNRYISPDLEDRKCLLPPPYTEENVNPNCEFVTYL
ncbi:alpha-protein kinase 1-like [Mya arenaria]|uniref:alpha-protein kinase 1-like n=1 Tax=Mya arenaria TaxID=6604 RepID=UPI0022E6D315|nr:alpha-protein kinase 1-like [Mya arenaria]